MNKIPTVLVCLAIRDAFANASDPHESPVNWLAWLTGCTPEEADEAIAKAIEEGFATKNERTRNGMAVSWKGANLILEEFAAFTKAKCNE